MVEVRGAIASASDAVSQLTGILQSFYLAPNVTLIEKAEEALQTAINVHDRLLAEKARLERRLAELPKEIAGIEAEINKVMDEIENRAGDAIRVSCVAQCCAAAGGVGCLIGSVMESCENGCNALFNELNKVLNLKRSARDALLAERTKVTSDLAAIPAQITEAQRSVETATANAVLAEARKIRQAVTELLKDADPLNAVLRLWLAGIDQAMNAYVEAGQEVSRNLIEGTGSVVDPYKRWLNCSAPAFLGTPSKLVAEASCAANDLLAQFNQAHERLRKALGVAIWLVDPVGEAKREGVKAIRSEVDKAVDRATRDILGMLSKEFADALQLLAEGSDPNRLTSIFALDESRKGLLQIPDIAARADSDMHRTNDGFHPQLFNAAYNGVVLAKLSLLNEAGLAELVRRISGGSVQLPPYGRLNILYGLARSIDGNHQWQRHAPPYFRVDGHFPKTDFREFGYGVGLDGGDDGKGLPLWKDLTLRSEGFLKMFRGPVAPALENACPKQFPDLLHPTYPYRTCTASPFADSRNPGVCSRRLVIESVDLVYDPGTVEFVKVEAKVRNVGGIATSGYIQSEIYPPGTPTSEAPASKGKPLVPPRSTALSERVKTDVVCDGELVTVRQTVFVRPFLRGGRHEFKVRLLPGVGGAETPIEFIVKEGLPVSECITQHRIRRGDTLEGIAKRYGVSSWRVSARNRLFNLDAIKAGTTICIPPER